MNTEPSNLQSKSTTASIKSKSTDELQVISNNWDALYSDDAVKVATEELARRSSKSEKTLQPKALPRTEIEQLRDEIAELRSQLPRTDLVHHKFWRRALAVYGHTMVGVLIMGVVLGLVNVVLSRGG